MVRSKVIHLAIDVMGGDDGPSVTIPAVLKILSEYPSLKVSLFGRLSSFPPVSSSLLAVFGDRVCCVDCEEEVTMDEKPSVALRSKQKSSLYRSIAMVGGQEADACVSAGNTGAFMAIGHYVLQTFPGIDRPAACTEMPTRTGSCLMLDLGANMDCQPENLLQFGLMGSVMASTLKNIASPTVGLLNIGKEAGKGNEQVRRAAQLFEENKSINYTGFIEGNDIYSGKVDVVVCDGFAGNVVLKASEGVACLITEKIRHSYERNLYTRLMGWLSRPLLNDIKKQLDPARYNGASLLGLQAAAVVSHGQTSVDGFANAIRMAIEQAELNLPKKIQLKLGEISS